MMFIKVTNHFISHLGQGMVSKQTNEVEEDKNEHFQQFQKLIIMI